ncbi:MAG: peptidoglycan-binding protein, partial [Acidimicrobiales bacterium]|nr:peptidoglycan-binding protein [Acidimicrobiales bacterium]
MTNGDRPGVFGVETQEAIRLFQASRNLEVDGICGPNTWASLIEASWKLGDRLLYRRQPMLRGDDIAELQKQFNMLGFDTGRIDGIFGDATLSALTEFQRNVGLRSDGVVGPRT